MTIHTDDVHAEFYVVCFLTNEPSACTNFLNASVQVCSEVSHVKREANSESAL